MATKSSWEVLCPDSLKLIVRKLHYSDAARFSAVCSSSHAIVKSSRVLHSPFQLTILGNQTDSHALSLRLSSFVEGKLSQDDPVSLNAYYRDSYCVGSSKNMLVLLDKKTETEIVLLNVFSLKSFHLPSLTKFDLVKRNRNALGERRVTPIIILKAVVVNDETNLILVMIYGCFSLLGRNNSIAYCHARSWVELGEPKTYVDILAREKRLFAMSDSGSVEAWDFDRSGSDAKPIKVMSFIPSKALPSRELLDRWYLVKSMGEFLLVRRRRDLVYFTPKADLGLGLNVYKSCLGDGDKWEEVENIGDERALFLGINESVSVSSRDLPKGCEGNSIYFCHTHDIGVYSLANKQISDFCEFRRMFHGQSFWMVRK